MRRKTTSVRRRAKPVPIVQPRRTPSPDGESHHVEIFSEDFKLLRTLLILLFFALVIYAGKVVDRWSAATVVHQHLEVDFFKAVQSQLLTEKTKIRIRAVTTYGSSDIFQVRVEPDAGAQPRLLVDAAAQTLQALVNQGVNAQYAELELPSTKGSLRAKITIGPLHPELAAQFESFYASPYFWAHVDSDQSEAEQNRQAEEIEQIFQLVRERCPRKPFGAKTYDPFAPTAMNSTGTPNTKPVTIRTNAPQAVIEFQGKGPGPDLANETTLGKLILFYSPDPQHFELPLQCANAYAPALAKWVAPGAPQILVSPGQLIPGQTNTHQFSPTEDTEKALQLAHDELKSSNLKFFDILQISFENLFYLFPAVLLIISAISSSVMRRIALSLPSDVQIGDVLLNLSGSNRLLSTIDGRLIRGVEKLVRLMLLSLSIFCPFLVILTLPIVTSAEISYEEASQPVIFLYNFAKSTNGNFWLCPLVLSFLLNLHQWSMVLSPPNNPLTHKKHFHWPLLLLLGLPSTAALLYIGGMVIHAGGFELIQILRGTSSTEAVIENLRLVGAGLLVIAAPLGCWVWAMRSSWLETRRGHRSVIGCCLVGTQGLLLVGGADIFKPDVEPNTSTILLAGGCVLYAWILYLHLKPGQGHPAVHPMTHLRHASVRLQLLPETLGRRWDALRSRTRSVWRQWNLARIGQKNSRHDAD